MKVRQLLTYYAKLKGFYDCQGEIDAWLERLGAADWGKKRIDSLSKGMAQKIQFISAVVARPKLVILDEPFSGLDPVNMEVLRDAVLWLREQGTTVLFSTHDMAVAERLCDTICMIHKGKKVLDGTLSGIREQFPTDRIRVRLSDPLADLPRLEGMTEFEKHQEHHEFRLKDQSQVQAVLQRLAAAVSLEHFEVIRPSLHDIFVRIAKPAAGEMDAAAVLVESEG
jgi:ABC-2 type transport system ATP-binding protein